MGTTAKKICIDEVITRESSLYYLSDDDNMSYDDAKKMLVDLGFSEEYL